MSFAVLSRINMLEFVFFLSKVETEEIANHELD
jgi:hypothetical protein